MQIAQSSTRQQYPLSTKKVWKKTIGITIAWAILIIVIYAIVGGLLLASENTSGFWIATLVSGLIILLEMALTYLYESWYFATYYYDFTADFISIRKNPITPKEITVPYERVQDVYMDQDLLDRLFGLYDVHISSATVSSGMEAHVDGLERTAAEGLRQLLLTTVSAKLAKNRPFQQSAVPTI